MQTQTTVTPKYINQPKKQGGKYGNVKDDSGNIFWVPVGYLSWLATGEAADIIHTRQKWGDLDADVVTSINGRDITGAAQPRGNDRPAPSTQHAPVRSMSDTEKALEIFCTGVTQQIARSGAIQQPGEIAVWLAAAKAAWQQVMQGSAPQASAAASAPSPPEDDIPPASSPEDYGNTGPH